MAENNNNGPIHSGIGNITQDESQFSRMHIDDDV